MRRNQKGFTLMELMVVIVIVAILAAVAVPLYINYVNDAKRTEAKGAIGAVITAEQTHFQKTGSYTPTLTLLNVDLVDLQSRWTPGLTVTTASGPTASFTVTMTATSGTPPLMVQCVYTRGSAPQWSTDAGPE